jgi:UDP-N-acetylmuramyl pentapeptide synthase
VKEFFVTSTSEGAAIDVGTGDERVRIELTLGGAIEVCASLAMAALPAAIREGLTIDEFMDRLARTMSAKLTEAMRHGKGGPS